MKISIHKKIIFGYLLASVITFFLALYAGYSGQKELEASMGKNSILLAEKMLDRMVTSVEHLFYNMESFGQDPYILQWTRRSQEKEKGQTGLETLLTDTAREQINVDLKNYLVEFWSHKKGYDAFLNIAIFDSLGQVLAFYGETPGGASFHQTDGWEQAKKEGVFIDHAFMDEKSGDILLPVAICIKDDQNNFAGVIQADILLSAVIREAQVESKSYETSTVRLICHEREKLVFSTGVYLPLEDLSQTGYFKKIKGDQGYFITDDSGIEKLFAYAALSKDSSFSPLNWYLLIGYDTKEVLSSIIVLKKKIAMGSLILILLGMALILALSSSIVKPIDQLSQGIEIIKKGDLSHRVSVDSQDEIQSLATAFNQMTAGLEMAEIKLLNANKNLESRVTQRTSELFSANQNLMQEIAERKAAEKKFRTIFNESPLGIALISSDTGKFSDVNKKYADILGYSRTEMEHLDFQTLTHPDDLSEDLKNMERLQTHEIQFFSMEKRYFHKTGAIKWVTLTVAPLWDDNKVLRHHLAMVEDITERKEKEKERLVILGMLQQAQKMESIGTLASGVAHEINNPINGIMNYAQLIKDNPGNIERTKFYGDEIIAETKRVATIVRNLLTFSRDENNAFHPENVTGIIESVLSLVEAVIRKDQIRIDLDIPDGLPLIRCQLQPIQQVLMNLITNAKDGLNERFKGFDENKCIAIKASSLNEAGREMVRISITDTGSGIPPDIQKRIFDPFFTTKDRTSGTGLGLSISYGIVSDHKGKLSVDSHPGKRTRFDVDLPVFEKTTRGVHKT